MALSASATENLRANCVPFSRSNISTSRLAGGGSKSTKRERRSESHVSDCKANAEKQKALNLVQIIPD